MRIPIRAAAVSLVAILGAGVLVAVSPVFTGAASAQTAVQADVTAKSTRPSPPCGAAFCGTANIAGYGAASWNWHLTGYTPVQSSCDTTYAATSDFTLASDGSTLVLNESGYICVPGKNGNGSFKEGSNAFGHPSYVYGTWTVDTVDSTGQFAGMSGSGTDALHGAGAHADGSFTGTLGS
jgi:hypothetical protein